MTRTLREEIEALRIEIERLPRRVEPISGQQFSYVKLDDVLALLASPGRTEPEVSIDQMDSIYRQKHDMWAAAVTRAEKAEAELAKLKVASPGRTTEEEKP